MKKSRFKVLKAALAVVACSAAAFAVAPSVTKADDVVTPESLWQNVKFSTIEHADEMPEYVYDLPEGAISNLLSDGGVRVNVNSSGSTVRYANVVDVSKLTKDDIFIQIAVDPSVRGSTDFRQIDIKLIDADDETNFVNINVHHSRWADAKWPVSFFQVGTKDVKSQGLQWGFYRNVGDGYDSLPSGDQSGFHCYDGVFVGNASNGTVAGGSGGSRPITISYDYNEKAFYTYEGYDGGKNSKVNRKLILDLDEATNVGAGNEWSGFTRGRVNVEITASDVMSSEASYIIGSFMGTNYDADVVDTARPIIYTEADDNPSILTAVAGESYPLFGAVADDEIDGSLTSNINKYIVYSGETNRTPITGDSFAPAKAGLHKLIYEVTDAAGNTASSVYDFTVLMTAPEITISATFPSNVKTGEKVVVPEATVSGGVGVPAVTAEVRRRVDGKAVEIKNGSFTPSLAGVYEIEYTAVDYLGNVKKQSYQVTSARSDQPIAFFPQVFPKLMVAGKRYKLPEMKSYDYYSSPAHPIDATVNVYVSGTESEKGTLVDDGFYTPEAGVSGTFYFTYETYCAGKSDSPLSAKYEVEVVDAKYIYDYFVKENVTSSATDTSVNFTTSTDGANVEFANPLNATDFEAMFEINSAKSAFSKLTVKFYDSVNSNESLTLLLCRNDGSKRVNVYHGGTKYELSGSFGSEYDKEFLIRFDTGEGRIYDQEKRAVMKLTSYDDGSEYKGFTSGKVYASFTFGGVTGESELVLSKLGNQSMYVEKKNGAVIDFKDYAKPILTLEYEVQSSAKRYERVFLPACTAVDAIDPYVEAYVTVKRGAKVVLAKTRAEAGGLSFIADAYGNYTVTFESVDKSGNSTRRPATIKVADDQPPTITVSKPASAVWAGKSLTIPKATALDVNCVPTLYVFLISPTGYMKSVTGLDKVTLEKAGTYVLRYYAVDDDGNSAYLDFTVVAV